MDFEYVMPDAPDGSPRMVARPGDEVLAAALASLNGAVVLTAAENGFPGSSILWANRAFEVLSGWSAEDALGRTPRVLLGTGTDRTVVDGLRDELRAGREAEGQIVAYRRDGEPFMMELRVAPVRAAPGVVTHFIAIATDVTEIRDQVELLERRAHTDPLTGLGNRRQLLLELGAVAVEQDPDRLGVLMIDVDRFKEVNDAYGHETGDEVLTEIARRIASVVRGHDVVVRWGGEEFCVLLPDVETDAEVMEVAERVRTAVGDSPIASRPGEIQVTVSVGAVRTSAEVAPPDLIGSADRALYAAKESGRNRVELSGAETNGWHAG